MEAIIYRLIDPRNNEVRYVGVTTKALNARVSQHIYDTKKRNNLKTNWINDLLNNDLRPIIEEIEKVSYDNYSERESYWIKYYIRIGADLVNQLTSGTGVVIERTQESIDRSANAKKVKIVQLDKRGNFIKEWNSILDVTITLNIKKSNIGNCLKGRAASAGGFIWIYKTKYDSGEYLLKENKQDKKVYLYDKDNNIVHTFLSIKEAAEKTNILPVDITKICYNELGLKNDYKMSFINNKDIV